MKKALSELPKGLYILLIIPAKKQESILKIDQ